MNFLFKMGDYYESRKKEYIDSNIRVKCLNSGITKYIMYVHHERIFTALQSYKYVSINQARQVGMSTLIDVHLLLTALQFSNQRIYFVGTSMSQIEQTFKRLKDIIFNCKDGQLQNRIKNNSQRKLSFDNGSSIEILSSINLLEKMRGIKNITIFFDNFLIRSHSEKIEINPKFYSIGQIIYTSTGHFTKNVTITDLDFRNYTVTWDAIPTRDEKWRKEMIRMLGEKKWYSEYGCEEVDEMI